MNSDENYPASAKTIIGKLIDKRNYYSNINLQIEAEIGDEKTFGIGTFGGIYYVVPIDDVIDVIFQAYRRDGEKNE